MNCGVFLFYFLLVLKKYICSFVEIKDCLVFLMVLKIALNSVLNLLNWEHDCWIIFIYTLNGIIFTLEILPLSCFVKSFSTFFSLQGLVNDKDSKDSMTEGENLEEDEEEEEEELKQRNNLKVSEWMSQGRGDESSLFVADGTFVQEYLGYMSQIFLYKRDLPLSFIRVNVTSSLRLL